MGQTERLNAAICGTLRKLSLEQPNRWNKKSSECLMAYMSKVHETHRKTPYELVFVMKMCVGNELSRILAVKMNRNAELKIAIRARVQAKQKIKVAQRKMSNVQDKRNNKSIC